MEHKPAYIALIVTTFIVYIVTITFNALAASSLGWQSGIFLNTTNVVSDVFYLEITPAGWMFSVWGVIYIWQGLWLLYGLSTICRKSDSGYLYVTPPVMPPVIYVSFILNNVFNVTWLFLWDRRLIGWALPFIGLVPVMLYIGLFFSFKRVYDYGPILIKQGLNREIWLIRMLVQNGIAFYATWVSIAPLLNVAMVFHYSWKVPQDTSCTIVLAILLVEILAWFIMDNFIFDKYTRYTFSPFIILNLALSASLARNWDPTKTNSIFTAVLMGLVILLTIAKLVIMIWKHIKRPIAQTYDTTYMLSYDNQGLEKN
ncbi:unnamed protein product [Owenia fusiformis]|uniref:Uncharacterized protein n=2 Tax=Owenia fusiformis TaxID=6347 RepID=A0A8J1XUU0_OWEFU|nr:unnamed protein product [Owenia fusiformis]